MRLVLISKKKLPFIEFIPFFIAQEDLFYDLIQTDRVCVETYIYTRC